MLGRLIVTLVLLHYSFGQEDSEAFSSSERAGRHASHSYLTPKDPLQVSLRDGVATRVDAPEYVDLLANCRFHRLKKPYQVTWKRTDGYELNVGGYKQMEFTGEYLRITNITRKDTGTYTCIASDGESPSQSRLLSLNIFYKPTVILPHTVIRGEIGDRVVLSCNVESSPVVKEVTWAAPPMAPDLTSPEVFSHDKYWGTVVESRLELGPLVSDHYGTYMCQANNAYGTSYATVTLAKGVKASMEIAEYVKKDTPTASPKASSAQHLGPSLLLGILISTLIGIFKSPC